MKNKVPVVVFLLVCPLLGFAQEVHVSAVKGGIALSVPAQSSYKVLASEEKIPELTVECLHKGKKGGHMVIFSPGGEMVTGTGSFGETNPTQHLSVMVGGKTIATVWAPYGDSESFAYIGKTEPERIQFIQLLISAGAATIEFKPFLTGVTTKSTFDLSNLREEINKHPECSEQ